MPTTPDIDTVVFFDPLQDGLYHNIDQQPPFPTEIPEMQPINLLELNPGCMNGVGLRTVEMIVADYVFIDYDPAQVEQLLAPVGYEWLRPTTYEASASVQPAEGHGYQIKITATAPSQAFRVFYPLDQLIEQRFLCRATDFNGRTLLYGHPDTPLRFSFTHTMQRPIDNAGTLQFTLTGTTRRPPLPVAKGDTAWLAY